MRAALASPEKEPVLHAVLSNRMVELRLMMEGFPRSEISQMSADEMQVWLHLISYMHRQEEEV